MENNAPEQQQPAPVVQQEQQAPAAQQATVRVMEIDYSGDPATIAREEVQARAEGIPIVRKGAVNQEGQPTESDMIRKMLSGEAAPAERVKANDAVRQFFQQNQLGDPDKMLSEYPSLVKARQELSAKIEQAEKDLSYLGKLSPEAQSVVQMDLDGKDWRKEIASRPSLDYGKPADKQDPKTLLDAYGDKDVTEDDWEEYNDKDGDPKVKALVQAKLDLYSVKYEADRAKATGYLQQQAELRKENDRKYTQSLEAGMASLHAEVPGSEIYGDKIKQLMSPAKLLGMFFEEDGVTLKPDGPKKAWLLSEMDTILQAGMKRMELGAQDAATKDFLRRTPERRTVSGRSQSAPSVTGSDKKGLDAAREAVRRRMMST